SARVDTVATAIEQATLGPDGTLYTVDAKGRVVSVARRVRVAWPQPLPAVPQQLFGAADQRLVAADPPKLITAAADQPPTSRPLPAGSDVAATRWGDVVAVATDSGVLLMDPLGRRDATFIALSDHPRALVFSPSGHRIYVARRTEPGLAAIDRFDREEIDGVALPLPAETIRLDPLGRWLLATPTGGDSGWLVDLPVTRRGPRVRCMCRSRHRRTRPGRRRWRSSSREPDSGPACSNPRIRTTATAWCSDPIPRAPKPRRSGASSAAPSGSTSRRRERSSSAALAARRPCALAPDRTGARGIGTGNRGPRVGRGGGVGRGARSGPG